MRVTRISISASQAEAAEIRAAAALAGVRPTTFVHAVAVAAARRRLAEAERQIVRAGREAAGR